MTPFNWPTSYDFMSEINQKYSFTSGRPISPKGLKIVSYSHDTVSLSWTMPESDTPILSFRIEKKEVRTVSVHSAFIADFSQQCNNLGLFQQKVNFNL